MSLPPFIANNMQLIPNPNRHPQIANRTAFMIIGCLEAAWAPLVPYVKSAFSLDERTLGLLMLCTGCALIGMGAANIVPQLISFASGIKGMEVHDIISIINALGYSGILIGPVLIGFVAKHFGLHTSFAGIAVFTLVVAVVSAATIKKQK